MIFKRNLIIYIIILCGEDSLCLFVGLPFDKPTLEKPANEHITNQKFSRNEFLQPRFLPPATSSHPLARKVPPPSQPHYPVQNIREEVLNEDDYFQTARNINRESSDIGRVEVRDSGEQISNSPEPISPLFSSYHLPQIPEKNIYFSYNKVSELPSTSNIENDFIQDRKEDLQYTDDSRNNFNLHSDVNSYPKERIKFDFDEATKLNKSLSKNTSNQASHASLKERSLLSDLFRNSKFPENEIISKIYSSFQGLDRLQKLVDMKEEVLPQAQRRYASVSSESPDETYEHLWNSRKWDFQKIHYTTVTVGTLMLFLILIVMILTLRVQCQAQQKSSQEWIRHPMVRPSTAASGAIQPPFQQVLGTDHHNVEPIRIKTKGLLERRGSNTSLTIDLTPPNEGNELLFTPSTECMNENFLLTAGNRMSRRQLRTCLRDARSLQTEFWQIPTNHPEKCSVPGAAAKNRYRTVLPNEETRVVLHRAPPDSPETPASQYINANYIRGYDGEEKSYIATQGPLAHTVEDLWLLVMQERSPAIVMITRLKEKGRVKCEPYVPSYSATYGAIQVTVKQVCQRNGYTIRQIYLKRDDEVHLTLHFWFTSWPDHKTPSSARHLLVMASEVEAARKERGGPVMVHCSAGIGRAGCFIAVSIGIRQLLEEDCVDVLNIVCQMRLDRGGMVQTAEQYEFIHRALALSESSLPYNGSN